MADDSKINYSDLIQEDDSLEKLVEQLEQINATYGTMVESIKKGAKSIITAINSLKQSTTENKKILDDEAIAANRLERAERELRIAMSETGKQVVWLNDQIKEQNRNSSQQQKMAQALAGSYNKLKLELQENISLWKSLSDVERKDEQLGGALLKNIQSLASQMKVLDGEIRAQVTQMSELEKAEQRLNFLRSEEGQKLIAVKREISELMRVEKEATEQKTALQRAEEKLAYLRSEEGQKLMQVRAEISELLRGEQEEVQSVSELEKAKQRLNYVRSEEYKKIQEVKQQIAEEERAVKDSLQNFDAEAEAARRLAKAQQELEIAMTATGEQLAIVKDQLRQQNQSSVAVNAMVEALEGSYNRYKLELQDLTEKYRAMSQAERESASGQQLLSEIQEKATAIKTMNDEMKAQVTQITELQKAEQRLAYLQSDEGKKLLEVKKQISEIVRGRKQEKQAVDELTKAQEKLRYAQSEENVQLQQLRQETSEANRIAKLTAQLNNSAVGSYNQLAAQYALNKIKLNAMSQEERRAVDTGQKLEQETLQIYKQMILLQEATGNHTLSVGHYEKAWNGLGNAMNQIVREMPSMAMGANTFFLAISNNLPILWDEIDRVREKNKLLRAEGKPTQSVMKTITASIFSWQTALIILISVLSMHGKAILDWCDKMINGHGQVKEMNELLDELSDELKNMSNLYGDNIINLRKLQRSFTQAKEKGEDLTKWVKGHKQAFHDLGVEIKDVTGAENLLIKQTDVFVEAMKHRARATAAMQLASKKYEEGIKKRIEAENTKEMTDLSWGQQLWSNLKQAAVMNPGDPMTGYSPVTSENMRIAEEVAKSDVKNAAQALYADANALMEEGDKIFEVGAKDMEAWSKLLASIDGVSEYDGFMHDVKDPKGREPRDLTDTIYKNQIDLEKKYEASITELQHDEYAKRKKEAADAAKTEIAELRNKYRKNEEYVKNVGGKYKALTKEQKEQIAQQQKWITATIANTQRALTYELAQISKEQKIHNLEVMRNTLKTPEYKMPTSTEPGKQQADDSQFDEVTDSLNTEMNYRRAILDEEEQLIKEANKMLGDAGRDENEITAEYEFKRMQLISEYEQKIIKMRQGYVDDQLEIVKKQTDQELSLLLYQNELARQMALSDNSARPKEEQVDPNLINKKFDKKATTIKGSFEMTNFDELQAEAQAIFNIDKHTQDEVTRYNLEAEKARWEKQIELAEKGGLDWSQNQIDAAKATVKGIDRQLKDMSGFNGFMSSVGKNGLGYTLLEKLGLDDDQIKALEEAANIVLEQLQAIAQAEVDLAQIQVDKAKERVEAAQSALDAEIEGRNNGYANNVATAKKELQQEKKNQAEKEKLLLQAQRRQEAINTVIQASSLITASANLWSSFSSIPVVGPALAIAAIAAMWTSFAVAKVKAAQVTRAQSQEYGEGGLEFLDGGSHASGNDIDLQTKNSKGKNMRAEGGEAMAIINKRSTRRYKRQLPSIIDSLNKGTFEAKYMKAFEKGDTLQAQIVAPAQGVDLTRIERMLDEMKSQRKNQTIVYPDGTILEVRGNVKRIIK